MADTAEAAPEEDEPSEGEDAIATDDHGAKPWLKMITDAEKAFEYWQTKCDNVDELYGNLKKLATEGRDRQFQMFYANLEVMKPSIYARAPQPCAVQRFKDSNKPVPRKAGELLERVLVSSFDIEHVHETLKQVRDNLARNGRGVLWERYEAYGPAGQFKECVRYEWVHRKDFLHEPSRVWAEVGWVARCARLTNSQGKKRFKDKWVQITFDDNSKDTADEYKVEKKAAVWELWHKGRNLVVWLHPHADQVLDIAPPHLTLDGCFPCPMPAYATCEPDSLIPIPDVMFYKDQLEEINELTARMSALAETIKMIGFYPSGAEDLGTAIETAIKRMEGTNRAILQGLPGFTTMGNPTALKDAILWMPTKDAVEAVTSLVALRKQLMDDVYELSGISDIMRGNTEASETLGAQQLKSQYGSVRIKDRQAAMVAVADGALNIAGEIMAENFQPQTLLAMSQMEDLPTEAVVQQQIAPIDQQISQINMAIQGAKSNPQLQQAAQANPDQAKQALDAAQKQIADLTQQKQTLTNTVTVEAVMALLRQHSIRPFVLQVATDSTIQPDENAEKAARNEFATAFAQMTTALGPLLQAAPKESAPLAGELLKFVLAPFRAGRAMDQAVDDFVQQMTQKAQEPQPPSPEMMKAQSDQQAQAQLQQQSQADLADREQERQHKERMSVAEAARAQQDNQAATQQAQLDFAAKQRDSAVADRQAAVDASVKDREAQARIAEIDRKMANDAAQRDHDQRMRSLEMDMKLLDKELAELRLKQAGAPKPAANGNGAAHA